MVVGFISVFRPKLFLYGPHILYRVGVNQNVQHVLMLFLHCIFAIVGMIFLYMAAFMYEDERGNQQNRLCKPMGQS